MSRISSADDGRIPASLTWDSYRSLQPANLQYAPSPLHMAIEGRPQLMFRLEPGTVLTRFGGFQRLENGNLGLKFPAGDSLQLHGDFAVAEDTDSLRLNADGQLIANSRADGEKKLGTLQLAEIKNPVKLTTENGVFFRLKDKARNIPLILCSH